MRGRALGLPVGGETGAAADHGDDLGAAQDSHTVALKQRFDADGHALPPTRSAVVGQPQLASPTIWRLARDRWVEVGR
jgi:hypothetical protein